MVDKYFLRQRAKQVLSSIDVKKNEPPLAANIFQLLSSFNLNECIIGAYAPLANEPDWRTGQDCSALQLAFSRPLEKSNCKMEFALSAFSNLVSERAFGINMLVPKKDASVVIPDLLLIPGLAFGVKGERLGRGGGFFDRYLAEFTGVKVGICFETQLCADLIMDEHDCLMDMIITERETYDCKRT